MTTITKQMPAAPVKGNPPSARERVRQDKFSTLHLPCFAPDKPTAKS